MTNAEVLWTIGSVVGIISFFVGVFMWFRVSPQDLTRFLIARRRTIFNVTYITVISTFTIFYISLFTYLTVVLSMFNFQWALLWVIVAFSTVGLWSPVLMSQRVWGGRFRRVVNWLILAFSIIILVGFWVISWPTDLLTPSVLTGVVIIALIASEIHRSWSRIKAITIQCWDRLKTKTVQCWDDLKTKTIQYWNRIRARIQKK